MANWFKGCYPTYNLPVYYEELEGRDPGYTMGWIFLEDGGFFPLLLSQLF